MKIRQKDKGTSLCTVCGIVHPKMKILSSFTHPHVVPNLNKFLSYIEHKRRYFEFWRTKQLMVPIDFHSISFPIQHSSKYLILCSTYCNILKLIQGWNDTRVSKLWQTFLCLSELFLYCFNEGKNYNPG